jgi:hypothetical protein
MTVPHPGFVGWLTVTAMVLAIGCSSPGNVGSVTAGDCFDDPAPRDDEVTDLPIVACDQPHDNEVYAVVELVNGEYPGDDTVLRRAEEGCLDAFEPYVGRAYAISELFATWLVPSEASWDHGDREAICVLFDETGPLEGSMRASGR